MIIISELVTKHVLVFMIKNIFNINKINKRRSRIDPWAGR
jgi:hypothetical protein